VTRIPRKELDGILILDKPTGLSSNKALQTVKHLLGAAKAGHTGSLDPLASGVLPLCFGEATKVSQFLLDSDKVYQARIKLGVTTTTGDSEGEVLANAVVPAFSSAELESALAGFCGVITQQAPIYSALKQDGVPLYKLARAGKEITAKFRDVCIHRLQLLDWHWPELTVEVGCSKGTYIRTLAEDLGKVLGTGAHLTALRRLQAGPFALEAALDLEQIRGLAAQGRLEANLIPADQAISSLPQFELDEEQRRRLRQGQGVSLSETGAIPAMRLYCAGSFIGIGEVTAEGVLQARRLLKYDQA